jgi:hypothetical protein
MMTGAPFYFSLFTFLRLVGSDQLGQPALLPGGGILMNDVLLPGTVQQFDGVGVGGLGLVASGGAHPLEGGTELAPLRTILGGTGATLTHALGGRPDSGHSNLGQKKDSSGNRSGVLKSENIEV